MQFLAHNLNANVHELTFLESSRRACQYLLNLLAQNFEAKTSDNLYLLLDMRPSGLLPLSYLNQELNQLLSLYPQHPQSHLALVIDSPEQLKMVENILSCGLRCELVQYFTDIAAARLWLFNPQLNLI